MSFLDSPPASGSQFQPDPREQGIPDAEMDQFAHRLVDYRIPMSEDERRTLGTNLKLEIQRYIDETQERRDMAKGWRHDFEMLPVPTTRWDGASEQNSPFTHLYCGSHTTRLNTQLIQVDPPLAVVARTQAAIDLAPHIEEALAAALDEAEWATIGSDLNSELPIMGNVFVRTTYEEDWIRKPEIQTEWNEEVFQALVDGGVDPEKAFLDAIKRDRKGQPKIGLQWVNKLKSAGPRFRVIPWEDGIVLPAGIRDPAMARGIGERLMVSGAELRAGVRQGKYLKAAVEALLDRPSDRMPEDRAERLDQQGIDSDPEMEPVDGADDPSFRWYECYELCFQADFNDDGYEEWAVITLAFQDGEILRAHWLPWEHGEPHYDLIRYMPRPNELWGMGIAELVACIQDAHTALLNQITDSADLALNCRNNYWYDEASGFDPSKHPVQMDLPIPVPNVDGIKPMEVQPMPSEAFGLTQTYKDMADLLTATSNPSLGQVTDASKTLGEVQLVNAHSNLIFEELASQVARQYAKVWDKFRWLLAQFGENGQVTYRKSATPGALIEIPASNGAPGMGAPGMPPSPAPGMGAPGMQPPGMPGMGAPPMGGPPMGAPPMGGAPNMPMASAGPPDMPMNGAPDPQMAGMGAPMGPGAPPPDGAAPEVYNAGMQQVPAAMIQGQMVPAPGGVAFGSIPAQMLRAEVDIVPTGLKQLGDANARLQQAVLVQNALATNPLTMSNTPVQVITLDYFLQAARFPQRERILDEVQKQLQAQAAIAALEAKMQNDAAQGAGANAGNEAAHAANQNDAHAAMQSQTQQAALQQGEPAPPPSLPAP